MVFHRTRRKVSHNTLFINNSVVTQVSCSKFLGIILDNKLNWTSHIAYIKLYYLYLFPYLIYCSKVHIAFLASQIHLQPLIQELVFHRIGLYMYKYEYCIIPVAIQ